MILVATFASPSLSDPLREHRRLSICHGMCQVGADLMELVWDSGKLRIDADQADPFYPPFYPRFTPLRARGVHASTGLAAKMHQWNHDGSTGSGRMAALKNYCLIRPERWKCNLSPPFLRLFTATEPLG